MASTDGRPNASREAKQKGISDGGGSPTSNASGATTKTARSSKKSSRGRAQSKPALTTSRSMRSVASAFTGKRSHKSVASSPRNTEAFDSFHFNDLVFADTDDEIDSGGLEDQESETSDEFPVRPSPMPNRSKKITCRRASESIKKARQFELKATPDKSVIDTLGKVGANEKADAISSAQENNDDASSDMTPAARQPGDRITVQSIIVNL
eukprot:NODE_11419_length_1288_cov_3.367786.p1 GENE.NODE_11419_length_1288_cov_3.367786~~NODE_11419_length_1288_cov_3.367786.p1  ORF type:complete len:210 (+),score=22.93 NODE_11419_length_1288_cov_3.367786:581-1210(+)